MIKLPNFLSVESSSLVIHCVDRINSYLSHDPPAEDPKHESELLDAEESLRSLLYQNVQVHWPQHFMPFAQSTPTIPAPGAALRRVRESNGLTQAQLAERVETRQSCVSEWEDVRYTSHSLATLTRLADACNCSFLGLLVNQAEWAASIANLACLHSMLLQESRVPPDARAHAYLIVLAELFRADCLTLYTVARDNSLRLLASTGIRFPEELTRRPITGQEPLRFYRTLEAPQLIEGHHHDDYGFYAREAVKATLAVPLERPSHPFGILFINYRRPVSNPRGSLAPLRRLGAYVASLLPPMLTTLGSGAASIAANVPSAASSAELLNAIISGGLNDPRGILDRISRVLPSENVAVTMYRACGAAMELIGATARPQQDPVFPSPASIAAAVAGKGGVVRGVSATTEAPPIVSLEGDAGDRRRGTGCDIAVAIRSASGEPIGVLAAATPGDFGFGEEHEVMLRWWGTLAFGALHTQELLSDRPHKGATSTSKNLPKRAGSAREMMHVFSLKRASPRRRLNATAGFVLHELDALVVSIWDVEPVTSMVRLPTSGFAVASNKQVDPSVPIHIDMLVPRPDGRTARLVSLAQRRPEVILDPYHDETVNDRVRYAFPESRSGALVGMPLFAPDSAYAEGAMWVWFDRSTQVGREELIEAVESYASLAIQALEIVRVPREEAMSAPLVRHKHAGRAAHRLEQEQLFTKRGRA